MKTRSPLLLTMTAVVLLAAVAPAGAMAPWVSSVNLVEHADRWDGERVSFTGEAIGTSMRRGDLTWLHLNDDAYAAGTGPRRVPLQGYNSGQAIIVSSELAERVSRFGSGSERGDIVRVEGVFHAADARFGGDMLIDADLLEIEREGEPLRDPVAPWKLVALVVLALAAAGSHQALAWRKRGRVLGRAR